MKFHQKSYVVIAAALCQFLQQLIANLTVVALPSITHDLNFAADTILWVNLIYLCALVAFCIPFAKVIDQYGVKKCTMIGMVGLLASVILSVFALDQRIFLISRMIQGLTSAVLSSSIYMMIVNEFEGAQVGSALGIVGSTGYVGMLLAPSFMGFMMYLLDWKSAFLILVPIVIFEIFILSRIKTDWFGEKRPIDNNGSLLYVVSMILFTYGIATLDDYGLIPFIISLILLFAFVQVERRVENPIYNLNLLKDIKYNIGNYAAFATYFTTTVAITALSFHLQIILDLEEYIVGLVLIIAPILMIGVSGLAGRLSGKYDPRLISGFAAIFMFVSMLMFVFMDQLSFNLICIACALQGLGNGLFSAPNNKYVLTLVGKEDLPDASAMLSTSKEFGKIVSGGIYTLLFSLIFADGIMGHPDYDYLLIKVTLVMMAINAFVLLLAAILLFYSKYRYDKWENPEVIELFKSLTPEWLKKRFSR